MDTVFLILATFLLLFAAFLYGKNKQLMDELKRIKDDISNVENIGDLLSVTESTLEEADKTIATAKRVMDNRIRRMEALLKKIDRSVQLAETRNIDDNIGVQSVSEAQVPSNNSPYGEMMDPDAQERALIAKRNREIIIMLGENAPLADIARKTGASMREISLIQKFIKTQ